ncbi:MAG: hypothetical protein H0Z39_07700 [Peptococcaceae bacterium]|nr:hypothetical protein [Peptococcaceae bacterium]
MKKIWMLSSFAAVILALYIGMAIQREHPMDQLYDAVINKINHVHVINFKSGFIITQYQNGEIVNQWQMKREGTYNAWSKYLNFRNVLQFSHLKEKDKKEVEEKTSLSSEPKGNMVLLPVEEAYFQDGVYLTKDRQTKTWTAQQKDSFDLLELLPFNAELLNRYAKHYKSENRGKFVVFFFSVDPDYLSRTFPTIFESYGYDFPVKFTEGTIKMLVYPDTLLPRRIYSIYKIENLETGEIFEFNIDTYYSEREI